MNLKAYYCWKRQAQEADLFGGCASLRASHFHPPSSEQKQEREDEGLVGAGCIVEFSDLE